MLKSITSNQESFKKVVFNPGFNVIEAERQNQGLEDDYKKTRNGAGKSTLIEIIHFCLGSSNKEKDSVFKSKELSGWSFFLEFTVGGFDFKVERQVDSPSKMYIHKVSPDLNWASRFDLFKNTRYVDLATYNEKLGTLFFGLSKVDKMNIPSYRELISYFVRRNLDGYRDPFDYFKAQNALSRQACNAYFLDLNMEYVSKFKQLKEENTSIKVLKKAAKTGVLKNVSLDIQTLDNEILTRRIMAKQVKEELDSFRVHPQYFDIVNKVDELTTKIHALSDTLFLDQKLLERYEESVKEDTSDTSIDLVQQIYEEAGISFSESLKVKLHEVVNFHNTILSNRKDFLKNEISSLKNEIETIREKIEKLTNERAEFLNILSTHGALEEYTKLQERYSKLVQQYEDVKIQKDKALEINQRETEITIETKQLLLATRQDYEEREPKRELAVRLFSENSQYLYQEPGTLAIKLKDNGYDFNIESKSSKSQGIKYMKVFCYDLLIAELSKLRNHYPGFLVHDSTVFDGVDERQIALALKLAQRKTEEIGFQYICMINSDRVPNNEFDDKFKNIFNDSVILKLFDSTESGGLLGIRF
jgi:uncharacterized protein YydD (DUF2326 family)